MSKKNKTDSVDNTKATNQPNQNNGGNKSHQKQDQNKKDKTNNKQSNQTNNRNNYKKQYNNLSTKDEFDLRERRLKLVYKVLYVAAALWAVIILSLTKEQITTGVVPFYSFLLSSSSVFIIRIIKYALTELRCMRIADKSSNDLKDEAETSYSYIWSLFGLSLVVSGIILFVHIVCPLVFNANVLTISFATCGAIILVLNIIDLIYAIRKKARPYKSQITCDIIGSVIGIIASYAICSIFLTVVTSNA
jgi:hypothetical protein